MVKGLDASPNWPLPLVVHCPTPLVAPLRFTSVVPQVSYGPPASAVAATSTITSTVASSGGQGPAPSGSTVVQVNSTVLPASFAAGVYVVVLAVASPKLPCPPLQVPPPGVVVTTMLATSPLQMV